MSSFKTFSYRAYELRRSFDIAYQYRRVWYRSLNNYSVETLFRGDRNGVLLRRDPYGDLSQYPTPQRPFINEGDPNPNSFLPKN